jgi:hypothetical protein
MTELSSTMSESIPRASRTLVDGMRDFYAALQSEGRPSLSRLDGLYSKRIRFVDPMRETEGLDAFRVEFEHMFDKYDRVYFPALELVGDDRHFMGTWTMVLRPERGPVFTVRGASSFRAEQGKVVHQEEYWDIFGSLFATVPALAPVYRGFVHKVFG